MDFMCYQCNFIYNIIDKDLKSKKCITVCTRFPPEPNGYLHIGHAKSICLNFGIANYYNGTCNLRFDDTNPEKEHQIYVDAIKYDIKWLGFSWNKNVRFSSDYFEEFYKYAIELIQKGLAYVDELSISDIKKYRGTLTEIGVDSPYRYRSVEENLMYFSKMRDGIFPEGKICLRAKINMADPSIIMRDPVLYRVRYTPHHRVGNKWCIYPTYDFSHCISDAIEGVTHSLCTLEFQDNRRLYNWVLQNISLKKYPVQYEFSKLNLKYTVTSKRKINFLIKKKIIDGWDDPRIPTIAGLRRRGYTARSIRVFCQHIGMSRQDSQIELSVLESCIRNDLNKVALRLMAVIRPIKVIIKNLPVGYEENIIMPNHPNDCNLGSRKVIFSKEIFIDRSDFLEKFKKEIFSKLVLGQEVRLRHAYIIKAESILKDNTGKIICIFCSYDPNTLNKNPVDGRKVNGVIHWVSATKNIKAKFRLYDKLFIHSNPTNVDNLLDYVNPDSLITFRGFVEKNDLFFQNLGPYQFEREGYFIKDNKFENSVDLIFNRTTMLKNSVKKFGKNNIR